MIQMNALNLIVGLCLLCLGQRLFWFFVGAAGFVAGLVVGQELLQGQAEWIVLVVAIVAGIIGALLAIFLQKLAIGVAGFLFGGFLAMSLALGFGANSFVWPAFALGGIVGAILVWLVFDWALILLSSLAGATLVVGSFALERGAEALLFVALFIAGIAIQGMQRGRTRVGKQEAPLDRSY
jgi:hypothetical protein